MFRERSDRNKQITSNLEIPIIVETVNWTAQKRKEKMPPNGKCLAIPVLLFLIILCEIRTGMVNSWFTGQAVKASNQCMKRLGNYKEHPVVVLGCFPASGSR